MKRFKFFYIFLCILNILCLNVVFAQQQDRAIDKRKNKPRYPVFITGGIDSFRSLSYTDYLDGRPVLFFSKQYESKTQLSLLRLANTVIFYQADLQEFCLDLLPTMARNSNDKKHIYRLIPKRNKVVFSAPFETNYEIFVKIKQGKEGKKLSQWPYFLLDNKLPDINPMSFSFDKQIRGNWQHIGVMYLSRGKHILNVDDSLEEIVVIPGREFYNRFQRLLEILSRKEKIIFIFSDNKDDNFFNVSFPVFHSGEFNLKLKLLPLVYQEYIYRQKETLENKIDIDSTDDYRDFIILVGKEFDKEEIRFEDINILSDVRENKGIINLNTCFDRGTVKAELQKPPESLTQENDKKESGEIRIYISFDKKKLEDFPYFSFKYVLEDTAIQDIKLAVLEKNNGKDIIDLNDNEYRKIDLTFEDDKQKKTESKVEVNLKEIGLAKFNNKDLVIRLKQRDDVGCDLGKKSERYRFQLSELIIYNKFSYPINSELEKKRFLTLLENVNPKFIKIEQESFHLSDFDSVGGQRPNTLGGDVLSRRIGLTEGVHVYETIKNRMFEVEWSVVEPVASITPRTSTQEPEIMFKKINPTKYSIKVEGAKQPFWLVFSESFHKQWYIYKIPGPDLGVKEGVYLMNFTPEDIRFLFKKPLSAQHYLVNGYANSWYIDPKALGLDDNFSLVLYFLPQSLFYLGLFISAIAFSGFIGYILLIKKKNEK